jgi:urease accessory protein
MLDGAAMASSSPAAGTLSALLQLTDGRFPTGGHAHSSGFEAAAHNEGINDVAGLAAFLQGRLHTTGRIMAVFTAAACHNFRRWAESGGPAGKGKLPAFVDTLDAEYDARTPSPVLRTVSRRLGRQIIRAGRNVWPHPLLEALASRPGEGLHQPTGFGAVAAASGQQPVNAALASAQENVCGPAMASIRLLGLDPFKVNALIARMAGEIDATANEAAALADTDPAQFPSHAGYLLDISAESHATWEVRLFAS